ncbi:putative membrane protein [Keratinibaculum paraultunense]|uniref:Putative membrane protein n=1 Tax=Keratinibaculum paraultunense TaxID=1278232 RepID=A0A4V2UU75_9FIRM|nr:DUF969 domain-containing protein [Keratinibaculum paraultunense]QQY79294.1 DUF969 domain-containing protein [Keratinibaculum paraultunense]TCS89427.1 putative membrane protein [Keratinibaculum paraultunense]
MIKLLGIVIIVIGFILKLDTIAVVIAAGVVTGLVGGLNFGEILDILGEAFVTNRYMTVFFVTLPAIGLLERYGLKERAAELIGKLKAATAGKILSIYMVIRTIAAALSLRIGGHVEFIRPLIYPMAEGAARNKYGDIPEEAVEDIKGMSAAVENYGNFYGQNVFIAAGGVLLIVGTLNELGFQVTEKEVANASIPIAVIAVLLAIIQFRIYDKKIEKIMEGNK